MSNFLCYPVRTRSDHSEFVNLPYRLYKNEPCWIPQLKSDEHKRIKKQKNPSLQLIQAEHFLARDNMGVVRARICAAIDKEYCDKVSSNTGMFGFFEAESLEASVAIIDAAINWLSANGVNFVKGPFSHRTTEDLGLLVKGFEHPARLLQTWNPPQYKNYIEAYGFEVEFTVSTWSSCRKRWEGGDKNKVKTKLEKVDLDTVDALEVVRPSLPFTNADYQTIVEIFNQSFVNNLDVVPLDFDTFRYHAKKLEPFLRPEHVVFFKQKDEIVAFLVALPDLSEVLRMFNGRLTIVGLLKLRHKLKAIDRLMIALIGAKPEKIGAGFGRVIASEIGDIADKFGYSRIETMWIDDRNTASKAIARMCGLKPQKKYAIFKKCIN